MALIGKIRNNSWLLIILIGLGLGGFLLMDMTSQGNGLFGGNQNSLGSIAGKNIDVKEFFNTEDVLYSGSNSDIYSRRSSLWDYFIEKQIVNDEAENLGLTLTKDEFDELQFGNKLSPIISASFTDPNTRQVDRNQLSQIKQAIETNNIPNQQFKGYWYEIQKQVKKDALQTKLSNLVSKGMYAPSWMVEQFSTDQNTKADFAYVRIPYDGVDNSEVNLTDADYQSYLNENIGKYRKDEETRQVGYLSFDIKASVADSAAIKAKLAEDIGPLRSTADEEMQTFITTRAGVWDEVYYPLEQLDKVAADVLFDADLGTVHGPYFTGSHYQVAKLLDRKMIPDSAESRHILIKYPDPSVKFLAKAKADSILNVLVEGTTPFDTLVVRHSEDQGSMTNGGKYDYVGQNAMVKPFNDYIFFSGKKGEFDIVETQFGFHIIEVLNRKYINRKQGVKIAYLKSPIIPSSDTQKDRYKYVGKFINDNNSLDALKAAAESDPNLDYSTSLPVAKNDFLIGTLGPGQSTRELIKYAFKGSTNIGDVSTDIYTYRDPIENYDNKYVVGTLESIVPAGNPTVASMKDQIEVDVINLAKANILKSKVSGTDLGSIANQFESKVDSVSNGAYTASFLPGLGNEPQVIAAAFKLDNGTVSNPIVGKNGVYVVKMLNKQNTAGSSNIAAMKAQLSLPYQSQVQGQLLQSMKKGMDIEDNRSTYY